MNTTANPEVLHWIPTHVLLPEPGQRIVWVAHNGAQIDGTFDGVKEAVCEQPNAD